MKKVPLKDFFKGTCKYSWCEYNSYGYCYKDNDIEHYRGVLEGVADNYGTEEGTFTCHSFSTDDNICEECGTELVRVDDTIDPRFPQHRCECPICD